MNKRLLSILLACAALPMINTPLVNAAENTEGKADRTILLYDCGADLETESGMASYNLRQILKANFSEGDNVKFVVMTGGSGKWHLESEYLCDPDNKGLSTDEENGEALHSTVTITDIYRNHIDISDKTQNPDEELVSIDLVRVKPQVETGEELVPIITYKGKVLEEGTDYTQQILPFSDEYIEVGEHTVHLEGKGEYAGAVNKEFIILSSEEELAETYLDEAQDWTGKAENFFNPGNSYKTRQLFNAQNALADALNALIASKDKLSADRKQEMENRAAELEKRIKALNDKLYESAEEIDFTNYFAVLERVFDYTGKEIEPDVRVPGLNKSDYTVAFEDNIEPGTAKALITGTGKYNGKISESFKILEKEDEPEKEDKPEKEDEPEKEDKPEKEEQPVYREGWVKTEKGWKYRKADGTFAKGWLHLGDQWFYLNSEGIMQTGWQEIDGERYYFDEDGVMQTGGQEIDGERYYFDEDGVMQTGWLEIDDIWYYFSESGALRK